MKRITKVDELYRWCLSMEEFSSVDIRRWGLEHYYISADRVVRSLVERGFLRKIPHEEVILRGLTKYSPKSKIAWYSSETKITESKENHQLVGGINEIITVTEKQNK